MVNLVLLSFCIVLAIGTAQAECIIDDDEEYAVLGALLFPNTPDIPEGVGTDQREAYLGLASVEVRLDGFHGSSYSIVDETIPSEAAKKDQPPAKGDDQEHRQACKISGDKLLAHVPPGRHVTLLSAEAIRRTFAGLGKGGGWEAFRQMHPLAGGITYLSRPAFNRERTEAVVESRHQADYHMGVGYRVHLVKSPKTGMWVLKGARMTRIS
ncbi:MAG: hypothetical protein C4576_06355 [Desulfobacteraceae bacterium]|nr:MAG: hypothetical protein C4576_06355 [Desulfobacteraceae bacterium]